MNTSKLKKIVNEEIDNLTERERRYRRRKRDPQRQPRVGREFKIGDATYAKSLASSDRTFAMRKEVTNYVYEARDLVKNHFGVTPPRVTYRIVDWTPNEVIKMDNAIGCATAMGSRVILIPASLFGEKAMTGIIYLRHIVFHELLHAIYCVHHDNSSPLMQPSLPKKKLSDEEMDKWYIKHVEESGKSHLSDERGERRRRY